MKKKKITGKLNFKKEAISSLHSKNITGGGNTVGLTCGGTGLFCGISDGIACATNNPDLVCSGYQTGSFCKCK